MASIFSAINKAVVSTLSTVTAVATSAEEAISIGTNYIGNASVHYKVTGRESWTLATALELETIQSQLDGNVKLQALFDEAAKLYDARK